MKACEGVMCDVAILRAENRELRTANAKQTRRRSQQRVFIANGGVQIVQNIQDGANRTETQALFVAESHQETLPAAQHIQPSGASKRALSKCSMCSSLDHTARTCPLRQR